jgi:hypothetical protein
MAANALAEDAAERRRGPVVGGVVPSKVRCARHRDEAQPPAPQVLLGLLIHTALDENTKSSSTIYVQEFTQITSISLQSVNWELHCC